MTKIADRPPAYCSSCFGIMEEADATYVDFEAAWDGPVIPGSPANIPVEDLVLCKDCLQEAARLLGLAGVTDEEKAHYEAEIEMREGEIKSKDKMIRDLSNTIRALEEHPTMRQGGKPALVGLSEAKKEVLLQEQRVRRASQKAKTRAANMAKKREKAKA